MHPQAVSASLARECMDPSLGVLRAAKDSAASG